ncbi:hypothetical protein O181_010648 [Austropuccinia psidii MF-1]|uniref:Tf2-1-like SH3-like domain-containing protein n=1 Tax=Austropuccinia psidii MF-1 TaxID=1389203 RepID=A0A9Q3GKK1_9BASI|nr:hypothetical protein [Austropuccinia psidii MF-1]
MLERGWNPKLPAHTLRKDLIDIHHTASSFKIMLDEVKNYSTTSMNYDFEYAKQGWKKSNNLPEFKLGDLVLVSKFNLYDIKDPKKLKDSYVGPFVIAALHGTDAFQVKLSGELENKHPVFPVSLIKPY